MVNVYIATENHHRNSGFSHQKWWIFSSTFIGPGQIIGAELVSTTLLTLGFMLDIFFGDSRNGDSHR